MAIHVRSLPHPCLHRALRLAALAGADHRLAAGLRAGPRVAALVAHVHAAAEQLAACGRESSGGAEQARCHPNSPKPPANPRLNMPPWPAACRSPWHKAAASTAPAHMSLRRAAPPHHRPPRAAASCRRGKPWAPPACRRHTCRRGTPAGKVGCRGELDGATCVKGRVCMPSNMAARPGVCPPLRLASTITADPGRSLLSAASASHLLAVVAPTGEQLAAYAPTLQAWWSTADMGR